MAKAYGWGKADWRKPDATPPTSLGQSIRKLRRYFVAHPERIPEPTTKQRQRHPWWRRKFAMDALRKTVGQS